MAEPDLILDTVGLRCPVPVIRLAEAAQLIGRGTIELLADDRATTSDIPAWCRMRSAVVLNQDSYVAHDREIFRFVIEVGMTWQ